MNPKIIQTNAKTKRGYVKILNLILVLLLPFISNAFEWKRVIFQTMIESEYEYRLEFVKNMVNIEWRSFDSESMRSSCGFENYKGFIENDKLWIILGRDTISSMDIIDQSKSKLLFRKSFRFSEQIENYEWTEMTFYFPISDLYEKKWTSMSCDK